MSNQSNHTIDYYDVLNVSHDAAPRDIVQAYRETKLIYQPESLATYSLYTEDEQESILEQIEEAYSVLGNPERRHEYDRQIQPILASKEQVQPKRKSILSIAPSDEHHVLTHEQANAKLPSAHITGAILKDIRESQGIDMDAIAEQTKISHEYLIAIEAEDVASFPAPIYLKSFLKQYAAAIGVDPELVIEAYDSLHQTR